MRGWKRWLVLAIGVGLVLGLVGVVVVYGVSEYWLRRTFPVPTREVTLDRSSTALARGEHLVKAVSVCGDCHDSDLGGEQLLDVPLLGQVTGPNITPGQGSVVADMTDAQLERAIRHAVDREYKGLLVMPSQNFFHYSDEDVAAIIAYLRQVEPVDREPPVGEPGLMVRGPIALGQFNLLPARHIDHFARRAPAPAPGATAEYGQYLVSVGGCRDCHGGTLEGGRVPGSPLAAAPSLTRSSSVGEWSSDEFMTAMRQGTTPDGEIIDPDKMPWGLYAGQTDQELEAIARYLQSLP